MTDIVIKRAALGRRAEIGDLYDATSEKFTGWSLLKRPPPEKFLKSAANFTVDRQFVSSDALEEKMIKLKIEPELQLSLLGDLVDLSGSGNYLKETKHSTSSVCCSLIYSVHTKTDHLDLFCNEVKNLVDKCSLYYRTEESTHVVAGIEWGVTSVVTMEHDNGVCCTAEKVAQGLQEDLYICPPKCALLHHLQFETDTTCNKKVFICSFNDLSLPNLALESCSSKVKVLDKMKTLKGIGVPQSYLLVPMVRVRKFCNVTYVRTRELLCINEATITSLKDLYKQFANVKKEFFSLTEQMKLQQAYVAKKDMTRAEQILSDIENAMCIFKLQLGELLVLVRRKKKSTSELLVLEKEFTITGPMSLQHFLSVRDDFSKVIRKLSFVEFFTRRGIIFFEHDSTLKSVQSSIVGDLYVLFYSEDEKESNVSLWNGNKNLFLDLVQSANEANVSERTSKVKVNKTLFAMLDTDLCPELVKELEEKQPIHLSHYRSGKCINRDVLQSHIIRQNSGCVRYSERLQPLNSLPNEAICFTVPCPGFVLGRCSRTELTWLCEECNELLEHCFDEFLYCKCSGNGARGLKSKYTFKCSNPKHGHHYIQFKEASSDTVIPAKELNILVLGETGVGKSTWINAVANYLSFASLEEAKDHDLMCLIGASFTVMDDHFQEKVVKIGEDSNEDSQVGQSATKCPKAYLFQWNDVLVRLIDTPGIGDTRGLHQDAANFEEVLKFISEYEELHGICILLKPNNARLGVMFKFCIQELLNYLHHSCSKNIAFCFTNARNTLYRPGDTFPALKKLLSDNKDVEIVLSKDTIYCFDNESFRCLCMLHSDVESDEAGLDLYSTSWERSVTETKRLFSHFMQMKAHIVQDTISLNDTRRIINQLCKPIASITQNILANIAMVEEKKLEIQESTNSMENLREKLCVQYVDIVAIPLPYPRTVCTSPGCVTYHNLENTQLKDVNYITHCHDRCYLEAIKSESCPNPELKRCAVMDKNYNCTRCGCPWSSHMHIRYEEKYQIRSGVDATVDATLKYKKSDKERAESFMKEISDRQKQLEKEQFKIMNACVKFGDFLNTNSLVQQSDVFGEHLAMLIKQEKDKCMSGGDKRVLEGLQKIQRQYLESSQKLKASTHNKGNSQISPTEMHRLVDELCALPLKGCELKQHILVATGSNVGASSSSETFCPPVTKSKTKCAAEVRLHGNSDHLKNRSTPKQKDPGPSHKHHTVASHALDEIPSSPEVELKRVYAPDGANVGAMTCRKAYNQPVTKLKQTIADGSSSSKSINVTKAASHETAVLNLDYQCSTIGHIKETRIHPAAKHVKDEMAHFTKLELGKHIHVTIGAKETKLKQKDLHGPCLRDRVITTTSCEQAIKVSDRKTTSGNSQEEIVCHPAKHIKKEIQTKELEQPMLYTDSNISGSTCSKASSYSTIKSEAIQSHFASLPGREAVIIKPLASNSNVADTEPKSHSMPAEIQNEQAPDSGGSKKRSLLSWLGWS